MPHRLAIVASHVIQYQDPFFKRLSADIEIDVTVLFCSSQGAEVYRDVDMGTSLRWDLDLLQGYRHEFLPNLGRGSGFSRLVNPGLALALARGHYDAVLFTVGWAWATAWLGFAACRLLRIPILLFGDSSFIPEEESIRAQLRAGVMRSLFGLTSGFMISGTFNADYYRHYDADPRRFFPMPWAIDNDRFIEASRFDPGERDAVRERYGIGRDQMAILFSAKLIERKDPMTLIAAFAAMKHRSRATLLFMGDGPLGPLLKQFVLDHGIPEVHFIGFVNQSEIPRLYAMCDVFVLPSAFDPRATVINEAMACGLPVVLTDRCGPVGDIARHGDNAFVFPFGHRQSLTHHLDLLAADPGLRRQMGDRSREIITTWSYEAGVKGIREALDFVKREPA